MEKVLVDGSTSHVTYELSDEVSKRARSVGWDRGVCECGVRGYKWLTGPIFRCGKRPWLPREASLGVVSLPRFRITLVRRFDFKPSRFQECQIEGKVDSIEGESRAR